MDSALGAIGLVASADGLVPDALRELDESVAGEQGKSGLVGDLAQLGRSDDEIAWTGIASKPRGETGRALLEVLSTLGASADRLRSALTVDYQGETDAALLGRALNVAHKA